MSRAPSLRSRAVAHVPGVRPARDYFIKRAPYRFMRHGNDIDRVLSHLPKRLTFMQLGSNDGITNDQIHRYVRWKRWRGVAVEPSPKPFRRLQRTYRLMPGVQVVNTAVAESSGFLTFYYVAPEPGDPWYTDQIGSFDREHVASHEAVPNIQNRIREMDVRVTTINDLCTRVKLHRVDLVHLDVEGFDAKLLSLLPYDTLRIKHVIFEHHHMSPDEYQRSADHLRSFGFTQVAATDLDQLWQRNL